MIIRDRLLNELRKELVGPSSEEEILEVHEAPRVRYGAGILFPRETITSTQEDDLSSHSRSASDTISQDVVPPKEGRQSASASDNADITDGEINRANDFLPSAMGITAYGDLADGLQIKINFAQYEKSQDADKRMAWHRNAHEEIISICSLDLLVEKNHIFCFDFSTSDNEVSGSIRVFVRAPRSNVANRSLRLFTITLLNETVGISRHAKTDGCLYQCAIHAEMLSDGDRKYFEPLPTRAGGELDTEELLSAELLYRHKRVYAVGHGIAPEWHEAGDKFCDHVRTEAMPEYEIKPILPTTIPGVDLSMEGLSHSDDGAALELCVALADHYEEWINDRDQEANDPQKTPPHLLEIAQKHLKDCMQALQRIRRGIELIRSDPDASEAFALMNKSMLLQQIHYKQFATHPRNWISEDGRLVMEKPFKKPSYLETENKWRPFQLAFILMTIPSIVLEAEEDFSDRALVDVIWFPTGGGKTEAYLGLAAFTILYRRLSNSEDGGCTVLMRYTLRLLTTQQFERASTLICALELLRREIEGNRLGHEEISIGLWVGGGVTPNRKKNAVQALNKLARGEGENSFVLLKCPWCGSRMGPINERGPTAVKGYKKEGTPKSVKMRCEDNNCDFSSISGLPVKVIDEEIYEVPPTLLVGTVDKFALLPWYPESRSIFGIDRPTSPPDLVIQDELHLISGPLGSMVGHYETLIDEFCGQKITGSQISCKIVASTATISRASEQIAALYGRHPNQARLFPPQGLKAGDSFFAEEDTDAIGRKYAGVFASGLPSQVTAQVRVMASLLQSPSLTLSSPSEIDPYWTLMTYFNSIRELGHAATLISADIPEYMRVLWRRFGIRRSDGEDKAKLRRFINNDLELTSRVPSSEVTRTLDRLFVNYDGNKQSRPVDVCLATNMIQVGLDVSRLGLMAVVGQPKTTAEYIQATSRVGRDEKGPGLVISILNTGKPRDRSHYEHFKDFHQSIYRHVEPTSVTPFSIRVSERAIHALIITLVRFLDSASREAPTPPDKNLEDRVRSIILERVDRVDPDERKQTSKLINDFISGWRESEPDIYGTFSDGGDNLPLMFPTGREIKSEWEDYACRATPSSMRNVDAQCEVAQVFSYSDEQKDT
jgi:hypothetical protein